MPNLNIAASYTYLLTNYVADPTYPGLSLDPEEPRHLFKLWSKYDIHGGRFDGLSLGAGMRAQSSTERSVGTAVGDFYTQGAYAVVDAQVSYKFNSHLDGSLSVKNLFDKNYFDRIPTQYFGIYGEPRSFLVSLKSHW
jgi:outer membrane receptor for ferric coprogen and ferric-rhodotorulic acid